MNLKKNAIKLAITSVLVTNSYFLPSTALAQDTTPDERPNFVIFLFDDMGFSDLGAFGSEVPTPNLDALATEGTKLTNFYAAATSTPSRAMLFTGKDNHAAGIGNQPGNRRAPQTDVTGEYLPEYQDAVRPETLIFPEVLHNAGYQNIYVGKWDLGDIEPETFPINRGFDQTYALLPGGDTHFFSDANGQLITTYPPAFYKLRERVSPYNKNGVEVTQFPPNVYGTEFYTDKAIEFLGNTDPNKPFFLTLAYFAAHSPLQAPAEDIARYMDTYSVGWDVLREQRFERQKAMGLWPANIELPPRAASVPAWDSLTPEEQKFEIKRMAIYAAMIDILDRNIGRVIDNLKASGEYENTVFFAYSDNGAAFRIPPGIPYELFDQTYENMGAVGSFTGNSLGLGMLSNTPFNQFKGDTFDGGVHTCAILHYPKAVAKNAQYDALVSVMDIAPTILDMAGVKYPLVHNNKFNSPMDGQSIAQVFNGFFDADPERFLGIEFNSLKGGIKGDWKIAQRFDPELNRGEDVIYLFNKKDDPFEMNNLAAKYPYKMAELLNLYWDYADSHNVIDLDNKSLMADMGASFNNNQIPTTTRIVGGTAVNFSKFTAANAATFTDFVEIESNIYPDKQHLGLPANIFVQLDFVPAGSPEGTPAMQFALAANGGLVPFDSNNLISAMHLNDLPPRLPVPVFIGNIPIEGTVQVWVGYELSDGSIVKSVNPLMLTINNTPS